MFFSSLRTTKVIQWPRFLLRWVLINVRFAYEVHGFYVNRQRETWEQRSKVPEALLHQLVLLSIQDKPIDWKMCPVRATRRFKAKSHANNNSNTNVTDNLPPLGKNIGAFYLRAETKFCIGGYSKLSLRALMTIIFLSGSRKEESIRTTWANSQMATALRTTVQPRFEDGLAAITYQISMLVTPF